jgi:hypothetical protein
MTLSQDTVKGTRRGRPFSYNRKRVCFNTTVDPTTREYLEIQQQLQDKSLGQLLDELIRPLILKQQENHE